MSAIGDMLSVARLIPQILALVDAIRLAAKDKELTAEEVQKIGKALIGLVSAIVKVAPKKDA